MKYTICLIAVLCVSCTPPNDMNISKGKYLCKDKGGLYNFEGLAIYPVTCNNGEKFNKDVLSEVIIEDPEYYPEK